MTSSAGTSARSVQAVKTNVSDCASMTDVSTAKMATFSSSSAPMNTHRLSGDIPAAIIAASDENRIASATAAHVARHASPSGQYSASTRPRNAATPLPPQNRSQTG